MFSLLSIKKRTPVMLLLIFVLVFFSKLNAFARPIISNANDVDFTVTWISSVPMTGEIHYGQTPSLGKVAYDVRGKSTSSRIHFVRISSNLLPETTYYFDVITGSSIDNNGGLHYSITTGPTTQTPPIPNPAYGQVVLSDGSTPADGALVYVTIRDNDGEGSAGRSSTLSSLVSSSYWDVQLRNARLLDLSAPFEYSTSGDIVEIFVYAPDGSTAITYTDTSNDTPVPKLQTNYTCSEEACDFIDNDCDGLVDETGAKGCTIFYRDEDGDGYGVTEDSLCLCGPEVYYTAKWGGDPNDQDPLNIPFIKNMEVSEGWNLISLPITPYSPRLSDLDLFRNAVVVYGYKKGVGFVRVKVHEDLLTGSGYWILQDQNQIYPLIGEPLPNYNISVENGWYMIGSCIDSANASVNSGSINVIYGFVPGTGYKVTETDNIEPGNGYWILFKGITDKAKLTVESIIP